MINKKAKLSLAILLSLLVLITIVVVLGGCAPLFIAAGVEIEHDEWCKTHLADPHCK
jgi:hypothetical protein